MWALLVAERNPVSDHAQGMHFALKAVPVDALLLESLDHPFHHPVLLWAVRGDELLLQAVAAHQSGVVTTGEHEAIVRAQQKGLPDSPKGSIARDQSLFQGVSPSGKVTPEQEISGSLQAGDRPWPPGQGGRTRRRSQR